jgi:hypothetical protein
MTSFDSPSREFCVSRRIPTNTPMQALITLNDPVYVEAAEALAQRMMREGGPELREQLAHGYTLARLQAPTDEALAVLETLYLQAKQGIEPAETTPVQKVVDQAEQTEEAAMAVVANVILNLDAIIMKE